MRLHRVERAWELVQHVYEDALAHLVSQLRKTNLGKATQVALQKKCDVSI